MRDEQITLVSATACYCSSTVTAFSQQEIPIFGTSSHLKYLNYHTTNSGPVSIFRIQGSVLTRGISD